MLPHVKTLTTSTQDVFSWNTKVLDKNFRVRTAKLQPEVSVWLHRLDISHNLIARAGQLNNKSTVLLVSRRIRIGLRHDNGDVRNVS